MRQAERKERLKRERLVEERYGQSLRQALLPLESESMLPVLVVTDMADRNVHTPYGLWSICSAFQLSRQFIQPSLDDTISSGQIAPVPRWRFSLRQR